MDVHKLSKHELLVYHGELDSRLGNRELEAEDWKLYNDIEAELKRRESVAQENIITSWQQIWDMFHIPKNKGVSKISQEYRYSDCCGAFMPHWEEYKICPSCAQECVAIKMEDMSHGE